MVVTNGLSSAPVAITVVKSAFGMLALNGSGTGGAAVYDSNFSLLSNTNATHPGNAITFWGSELGPTPAPDETVAQTGANASGDLTSIPITVQIGGVNAQVLYRGRSAFPGLDQINVVVPTLPSTTYSCAVGVLITTNDVQANALSIPVAASGNTPIHRHPAEATPILIQRRRKSAPGPQPAVTQSVDFRYCVPRDILSGT